jgi:hypothetical protein
MIRAEIEELHAKLAQTPTRMELARTAVGIIFCAAVTTTFLNWWFLAR